MFLSEMPKMKILILLLTALLCGCTGTEAGKKTQTGYPVEKAFNNERKTAAFQLAQNYIDALNTALKTGDFAHIKKALPSRGTAPGAAKIFQNLKKRIDTLGRLESCTYNGVLDCTLFVDHLWKYRFIKPTDDPRLPEQCYEVLYRVRVIYPDKSPKIITADFLFR